eukprot:839607-Rhodomonas_salina.1
MVLQGARERSVGRSTGRVLRYRPVTCYGMSGTDVVYHVACYAMSGTELAYPVTCALRDVRY